MARKVDLRRLRSGTVINTTSKKQESDLGKALQHVVDQVTAKFTVKLYHETQWKLSDIIANLRESFPAIEFHHHFDTSSMRPDGGFLSIVDQDNRAYPILITEVKNQGTNDLRIKEGKAKQARGNAIERLGKNVIGIRTAMMPEGIVPFICFGYGCDFANDSSILDRVSTIAMFGPLNQLNVVNQSIDGTSFNRGSFFFREQAWSINDMQEKMFEVASRAIHYYFACYGPDVFHPKKIPSSAKP